MKLHRLKRWSTARAVALTVIINRSRSTWQPQLFLRANLGLAIPLCAVLLFLAVSCGDGNNSQSVASPSVSPETTPAPDDTLPPTPSETELAAAATSVAGLRDLPGLLEQLRPSWRREGEPGAKLTELCAPSGEPPIFAEATSSLLLGPSGGQARAAVALFFELSDARPYMEELLADAVACAARLSASWLAEDAEFTLAQAGVSIGDEAIMLSDSNGDDGVVVVLFRRRVAVAAVVQVGPDTEDAVAAAAAALDEAVLSHLETAPGR